MCIHQLECQEKKNILQKGTNQIERENNKIPMIM